MEVICLEEEAFYKLIEEVVDRLGQKQADSQTDPWITPQEAMGMLNIKSPTTMQKLRNEGKLRFSQPSERIILYHRDSIHDYLETKAKDTF